MVNIGTRIAPVNIAFSFSRNAALIECKVLQITTLFIKLHHCTLSEVKTPKLQNVGHPCLCLNTLRGSESTLKPGLLTESINNPLQTFVDLANEYLQTYNTGAGVKKHVFL